MCKKNDIEELDIIEITRSTGFLTVVKRNNISEISLEKYKIDIHAEVKNAFEWIIISS